MKKTKIKNPVILLVLAAIVCILPLYGQEGGRGPIDVNLIIDGSSAYDAVRGEINQWLQSRLDQILADGDRVTIWNAGSSARVIYTGVVSASEKDVIKRTIREMSAAGDSADFTGALREASRIAASQQSSYSYTLLISASPHSISGGTENLLRYSRVEEFTNWRALVVGLNLETRVRRATSSFFGS